MAKKKTYYIPTIETIPLVPGWSVMIADSIHGSVGGGDHAPKPRKTEVF